MLSHGDSFMVARGITDLKSRSSLVAYLLIWLSIGCHLLYSGVVFILDSTPDPSLNAFREISLIAGLLGGLGYAFSTFYGERRREIVVRVGLFGITLLIVLSAATLLLPPDSLPPVIAWLVDPFRIYVAYPLSVVGLLYWLYRRFSNVPAPWADTSLMSGAMLLAVSGVLRTLPMLFDGGLADFVSTISAGIGTVCYLVFGAHGFRALSDRNQNRVLSAPWAALALLLIVLGGCLGSALLLPDFQDIRVDPVGIADPQGEALYASVLAVILAMGNQMAAELRGQNQRVTGWIPYWLVTGGTLLIVLGLSSAGLVQSTLSKVGEPAASITVLIAPLIAIWRSGASLVFAGLAVYALTYFLRRPKPIDAPHYRPRR